MPTDTGGVYVVGAATAQELVYQSSSVRVESHDVGDLLFTLSKRGHVLRLLYCSADDYGPETWRLLDA